jgi:hypothetical protein
MDPLIAAQDITVGAVCVTDNLRHSAAPECNCIARRLGMGEYGSAAVITAVR